MITLLSKLWIKNRENTTSNNVRQAYGMLCGAVGIFLNILLFAGKLFAGTMSNSIAITADAFNNLSDAGSSLITLVGFKLAGQKPDPDHPFGHGRLEYITGLIVSGLILIMAFELLRSSVEKILHPEVSNFTLLSAMILLVSILIKLYMYIYNTATGKKINSAAMMAAATDSLSDSAATLVVLASGIIGQLTHINIDGYCGILVGCFIFYAGISAAKDTLDPLLGQPPEKEFVDSIEALVLAHDDVLGIHDLIVHNYGPGRIMISLHAEVSSAGNILDLHDMIDNIEHELARTLGCEAVIHMDPIVLHDETTQKWKALTLQAVHGIDDCLTIHDFRIVEGPTHTNLIFDVVAPMDFRLTDEELTKQIEEKLQKTDPACFAVITVDKPYL